MRQSLPAWNALTGKGFRVHQVQAGFHEFVARKGPPGQFPFSLALEWGPARLADFLNPAARDDFLTASGRGAIRAGAWMHEAPCSCTVEFRCLREARVRTRAYFPVEGRSFEYIGERLGLRPWNLRRNGAVCYGVIYDLETGEEVSRSRSVSRCSLISPFPTSVSWIPAERKTG